MEASLPSQLAEKNRTNSRVVEDQAKKFNDNAKNERKSIEQKEKTKKKLLGLANLSLRSSIMAEEEKAQRRIEMKMEGAKGKV